MLGRPTKSVSAFHLTDSEAEASSPKLQAPPRPAGPRDRDSALPLQGLIAQADPASNHPQSPEGPLCQLLAEGLCFPSPTPHQPGTEPPRGAGGGRRSHSGWGVQAGNVGAAVSPCTPQGPQEPNLSDGFPLGTPSGMGEGGQRSFWVNPQLFLSRGFPSWLVWGATSRSAVRPPPAAHTGRGHGDFSASPGLRSSSCPSSEEKRAGLNELGHSEGVGPPGEEPTKPYQTRGVTRSGPIDVPHLLPRSLVRMQALGHRGLWTREDHLQP